ncbi:MAG: hypothetical protein K6T72_14395 [Anoxybacillus sp.]|nr:hypothetical protein [Anoxybacillus sp.]MCL6587675.1 hypothetical protein [Anoxybacillus sp.]
MKERVTVRLPVGVLRKIKEGGTYQQFIETAVLEYLKNMSNDVDKKSKE